jgi:lipopolysaccharide export system protein LptA
MNASFMPFLMPLFFQPITSCVQRTVALSLLAGSLLGGPVWAERADRDKPMNAEADALRYDDARQTSVFNGNVVITKGTIIIRGAQVEVRQDAQGGQFGLVTGSTAVPAFFRQKRDVPDEFIEGQALRIEYDSQADTVRFIGSAVLRRYRGTQLNDETSGAVIVYNGATDMFTVDGGGVAARTPTNPTGRVRAMITPVPKNETPPPASPPLPLRPSGQIGEGAR